QVENIGRRLRRLPRGGLRCRLDLGEHRIDLFFLDGRLRWRRLARLGRGLARVVISNDPADGGENLLHRGLLTLRRRLRHWPHPHSDRAEPELTCESSESARPISLSA